MGDTPTFLPGQDASASLKFRQPGLAMFRSPFFDTSI
jgi:hypothetical protein